MQVSNEYICQVLSDYVWMSSGCTVEEWAEEVANNLKVKPERVVNLIKGQDPDAITNDMQMDDVVNYNYKHFEYSISVYDKAGDGKEIYTYDVDNKKWALRKYRELKKEYKGDKEFCKIELSRTPYIGEEMQDGLEIIRCDNI